MNCSEVMVRYLKEAGIGQVFGYPGDPSVPFLEACRLEDMPFVLATREGTAGLMAEAYGQLTDLPGVCLSTLGPGSSNTINAVASAYLDRAPMIAISGQIETRREALFTHQVMDHNRVFAPITKWTTSINPHTVGGIMRRALRLSVSERPGPIHISTPGDFVGADAVDAEIRLPPLHAEMEGGLVWGGVEKLIARIKAARRPVILAGVSAIRSRATAEITALAEQLGAPLVVSPMAKGIVDETHPYFAGTLDMACNKFIWDFLKSSDLILAVGFDAVELIKPWTLSVPVVHIDSVPNTDQIYQADLEAVGPIAPMLSILLAGLRVEGPRWTEAEIAGHRAELRRNYLAGRVQGRLNPSDVVETVLAASSKDTLVTSDVGSHKLLVGQGWVAQQPKGVLMSNGLSSMGYGLPAAMTGSILSPERDVVCFTGDGGLAMVQGELRTASALKLGGLTVVVFCDNSLNRIELKQLARQYPSFGTRIEPTDVPLLASSMECDGVSVSSIPELERVLANRRPGGDRPLVIAAQIDPSQYAAQF
ncbi:thiamine pyrophosphate-binding protein [Devosia sp.]|uniref:thiamine pyrophosphate-binding protein n=1 Tax=Devosia sp. TaxID=1871048 RepID=UPI0026172733|nr:thiamine pyrophosphate-binding protein [Devosia sp.]